MIDYEILRKVGTTRERLMEFFTAEMPSQETLDKMTEEERVKIAERVEKDIKKRDELTQQLCSWINEGMVFGLSNYSIFSSLDLAWDSRPIQKHVIPLLAYAEGRIDFERCRNTLKQLPAGQKYVRKGTDGKEIIDLPTFFDMNINLIRSVINRRKATQCNRYNNLWPFFKYEARSTSLVARLRADATSQRMDIMADQYDYRQQHEQVIRNMMLYPFCVTFPRAKWERDVEWTMPDDAPEFTDPNSDEPRFKSRVNREGISWVNPHPCRIIWDNNYPLSSINSDTGSEFIGFWDVMRYKDIKNNPDFFNRDKISYKNTNSLFHEYASYFNQYYDRIKILPLKEDVPGMNDRVANVGVYTATESDMAVFFTELFVKVVPRSLGIGDYPFPVWLQLKVAGDDTVIYADIMPSRPAAYFGWNNNDGRLLNPSMGHELMQLQDQLTNLFTKLLKQIQQDLFQVMILNRDIFPDSEEGKKAYTELSSTMKSENWYSKPVLVEASFEKLRQLGINITPDNVFQVVKMPPNDKMSEIFRAISEVISMADRLHSMTSQEQGQPSPNGISATETSFLAGAKENIDEDLSNAIDRGRSAMKIICYESWQSCGSSRVQLPVSARYTPEVIVKAGFEPVEMDSDMIGGELVYNSISGTKEKLIHDYIFTSRDGTDRVNNVNAANAIVSALQAIHQAPEPVVKAVLQKMGATKYFSLLNTVFRLSTGEDLGLEVAPGEDDNFMMGPSTEQQLEELAKLVQQLASKVEQNTQELGQMQSMSGIGQPMMQPAMMQ